VRNEEKLKYEKISNQLAEFFKEESAKLYSQYTAQRHQLVNRTSQLSKISKFIMEQEYYISNMARIVSQSFEVGEIIRIDGENERDVDRILEDGKPSKVSFKS